MNKQLVLIFTVITFLTGCVNKREYARYELINSTNHGIVIHSFNRGETELQKIIEIQSQEQWVSDEFDTSRGRGFRPNDEEIYGGDSLIIIFNQTRLISNSFSLIDVVPDLFSGATYQRVEYADHKTALRYVFTEDDYNNATLIEN